MRVLHLDTERGWRGGQQQLLSLAAATGQPVLAPADSALAQRLRQRGLEVSAWSTRGRWWGGSDLRRWVQRLKPDLLAAHTSHAIHLARGAGLGSLPIVAHRRLDFVPSPGAVAQLNACPLVVAVSQAVASILVRAGVERARVRVVWDGVDAPPTAPAATPLLPSERLRLLAAGALVAHKDHHTLVEALARLPEAVLCLLGEGPLRSSLVDRATRLGVLDRLALPGHQPIAPYLAWADLLVHPSREEGLGQVVLEARMAGVPVLTSGAGGLEESGQGWPFFAVGSPPALAGTARAMAARLALYRARALREAPEVREQFSVDRMVRGTTSAYTEVLGQPGLPPRAARG